MYLSKDQAIANISAFYDKYISSFPAVKAGALSQFDFQLSQGSSISSAYEDIIVRAALKASTLEDGFSIPTVGEQDTYNYKLQVNSARPEDVVKYFYSAGTAAEQASLVSAIKSGTLSSTDFVKGISVIAPTNTHPSPTEIISKAADPIVNGIELPQIQFNFPGLNHTQEKFLVSLYVAAFDRAPEYEGLKFWAAQLASKLTAGETAQKAYVAVSKSMYTIGAQNGEGGTKLGNADYVNLAYTSALGRQPDAAGKAFWADALDKGTVQRGDFLATFLTTANGSDRDSTFLESRIAVAQYAAQKHISGTGAPGIDAHAIIQSVNSGTTALSVINGIVQKYGAAPIELMASLLASWADTGSVAAVDHTSEGVTKIALVGVADHSPEASLVAA
jgi:hypothetical protein